MTSPAWLTQRSLAIITFDEDAQDYQHPAQRVPTIIVGSAGVKQGYVSTVRYTHYSLLRTIEGALGLATLGRLDKRVHPTSGALLALLAVGDDGGARLLEAAERVAHRPVEERLQGVRRDPAGAVRRQAFDQFPGTWNTPDRFRGQRHGP